MKKIVLILLCAAVLAVGCTRSAKNKPVTLTYYNIEKQAGKVALMKNIAMKFEKLNPGIRIEVVAGVKNEKIMSTIASGSGLDIFYSSSTVTEFISRKAIIDLTPYMDKYGFDFTEYYPVSFEGLKYQGRVYGLPVQVSTDGYAYNQTLLENFGLPLPPAEWNFDEFIAYAGKLFNSQKGKSSTERIFPMAAFPFHILIKTAGKEFLIPETAKRDSRYVKDYIELVEKYKKLIKFMPRQEEVQEMLGDGGYTATMPFKLKRAFLCHAPSWLIIDLNEIRDFSWDIVKFPLAGKDPCYYMTSGYLGVSSICRHPEAAYKFIKFYISEEGANRFASMKNGMSARIKSTEKFFTPPPAAINRYVEMLAQTSYVRRDFFLNTAESGTRGKENYFNLLAGKISAADYVEEYYKISEAILEVYNE